MSVKLIVDEAYAFDYLSILEVKYKKTKKREQADAFVLCAANLANQLSNYYEIIDSPEYEKLVSVNELIFETIDILKKGDNLGLTVDNLNYRRYVLKRELQEKFFPDKKLIETKIGYQ